MQFITSGNRIAVENFTVGYLYTITFTNGDYIHSACTGIGMDFVMFTRTEPEYTFALTMETAADVSSIDLYSEGGGTTNYNELANKPQINSVELVGNKSLNDLGIQPLITNDNKLSSTLVSGLGTAAASDASDFATAAEGALAATAVQPADLTAALSTKQNTIDSSHKLSADLVDDTSTTNKFATAAELQQIETNKTNILSSFNANGQKNIINPLASPSGVVSGITYTKNSDGSVRVQSDGTNAQAVISIATQSTFALKSGTAYVASGITGGSATTYDMRVNADGQNYIFYDDSAEFTYNGSATYSLSIVIRANQTLDITFKPMICEKSLYNISSAFQPYAMTNAEITAWILAHS